MTVDKSQATTTIAAAATSYGTAPVTRKPPLPHQTSSGEDAALNEKIENIRKEHEKNMQKRIQERVSTVVVGSKSNSKQEDSKLRVNAGAVKALSDTAVDTSSEDEKSGMCSIVVQPINNPEETVDV